LRFEIYLIFGILFIGISGLSRLGKELPSMVFIKANLLIDHGHNNQRGLQNPVEDEKGQTSTGGRHFYDWLAKR
jgi:hypothetical protein